MADDGKADDNKCVVVDNLASRTSVHNVFTKEQIEKLGPINDVQGPLADETQHPEQLRISKYLVWRFVS